MVQQLAANISECCSALQGYHVFKPKLWQYDDGKVQLVSWKENVVSKEAGVRLCSVSARERLSSSRGICESGQGKERKQAPWKYSSMVDDGGEILEIVDVAKSGTLVQVVVTQMNGVEQPSQSIHILHVGKMRMKLGKGKTTIAKDFAELGGGGNAAAQALYWLAKPGLSFILAFESERDRNAAIMLARRFAFDCNIMLAGPGDRTPVGA
ncbi:hypothetical protein Ancab_024586 [Ancistrocladus abbreviatus]